MAYFSTHTLSLIVVFLLWCIGIRYIMGARDMFNLARRSVGIIAWLLLIIYMAFR